MKIYLAGTYSRERLFVNQTPLYILESFYYVKNWQLNKKNKWKSFLLDSGAFTFLSNNQNDVNWNEYIEKYADFINKNKIDLFFELDIDSIIGLNNVEKLREKLQKLTGKQPIPVWHKSRGKDNFLKLCDEYKYVAIGGIVSKEISKSEYRFLPWFIQQAHERGAKIHGLGFTSLEHLKYCKFDSVDSTSWLSASRFGQLHYFDGKTIKQRVVKKNEKTVHYKKMDDFVFGEWIKFQKYANKYL